MPLQKKQLIRLRIFTGCLVLANIVAWYYYYSRKPEEKVVNGSQRICETKGLRRTGFRYTKPLLMLENDCDDPTLDPLRDKVILFLADEMRSGKLRSASVYFRVLGNGKSFNINNERYSPGSLMKIMTLITYLKDAEKDPALLRRKMMYVDRFTGVPSQIIPAARRAEIGKPYTVKELLELMIVQSDNNATIVLNSEIDAKVYNLVLTALQLPIPKSDQADYPITAEEYSRFLRLLYNSSFLSPEMSDYALELLSKCAYTDGFSRYLKDKAVICHKFGERNTGDDFQLHEGAIFLTGNIDYLLVLMARGNNQEALKDLQAGLAKLIFEEMVSNYGVTIGPNPPLTQGPVAFYEDRI